MQLKNVFLYFLFIKSYNFLILLYILIIIYQSLNIFFLNRFKDLPPYGAQVPVPQNIPKDLLYRFELYVPYVIQN